MIPNCPLRLFYLPRSEETSRPHCSAAFPVVESMSGAGRRDHTGHLVTEFGHLQHKAFWSARQKQFQPINQQCSMQHAALQPRHKQYAGHGSLSQIRLQPGGSTVLHGCTAPTTTTTPESEGVFTVVTSLVASVDIAKSSPALRLSMVREPPTRSAAGAARFGRDIIRGTSLKEGFLGHWYFWRSRRKQG